MKIISLIRENERLVPVEVEISFIPGLPQIQFLGLPDQGIKESIFRIKSALREQGFEFPKAQHVLVNLRPAHLKKSSRGLELAVALGILWETHQISRPEQDVTTVYGELSLNGQVYEPDDLCEDFATVSEDVVWTGARNSKSASFSRICIKSLSEYSSPEFVRAQKREYPVVRPDFGLDLQFPPSQAEILKLVALGEHSLLLAGPSGSGKSTLAKTLGSLLSAPSQADLLEIIQNNKGSGSENLKWKPMVHPHHSTSPLGLIGGGVPPFKGDVSKAHKGILILDELLEFNPRAQEALREPMEEFCIRLRRGRYVEEFPAEALIVSTTNLCPCGDWVPKSRFFCGRSLKKCQSYMERLSGPLVDRFQIVHFTRKREVGVPASGSAILHELEEVRLFRETLVKKDNRFVRASARWSWEQLILDFSPFYMREIFPKNLSSRRRELSTLRVARTFADLDKMAKTQPEHVERALKLTYFPFEQLKRLDG